MKFRRRILEAKCILFENKSPLSKTSVENRGNRVAYFQRDKLYGEKNIAKCKHCERNKIHEV